MPRLRSLLVLVAFAAACEGCPEEGHVSTLSAAFSVAPAAVDVSPLWAGHPHTVTLSVESRGEAPLLGLSATVEDRSGPVDVTASLAGDALAPGGSLPLTVGFSAAPGSAGSFAASLVVDGGADGSVVVPLSATVVQPPSCDDGNPCTDDDFDPTSGRCQHEPRANGASCDDGSACTSGDACLDGRCLGEAVSCVDGAECTVDACDPDAGCVFEPLPSRCADDDPCTEDVCEAFSGCSNPPLEEGALCHFDGCAEIGLCFAGECVLSDVPDGMPCEDGDACTANDTCQQGECTSGPALGVGAAPPFVLDPVVGTLDLCRGPGATLDCFGLVEEPGLERVLAVDRTGARVRVVWQGGYADSFGASCDPTDPVFEPIALDPPDEGDPLPEGPGGGAMPASLVCAAGVYLTSFELGFGWSAPTTTQLTSVRGPAAAAFVPDDGVSWETSPAPDAEEPPPPLPPPLAAVVVVHPDFLRTSVWVEERDELGNATASAGRHLLQGPGPFDALAVAVDGERIVVAAHAATLELPNGTCDGPGCDVVALPLSLFAQPRYFTDGGFAGVVYLPRTLDAACDGVTPGAVPVVVSDLTLALHEQVPRVSLRMSRSVCGDVAPGTLGAAVGVTRPWRVAAWAFEVGPLLLSDPTPTVEPLESYADGSEPLGSFRTTPDGGAVALRHVPAACDCDASCASDDEGADCACVPSESTCFDTVVERTPDVATAPPEVLLTSAGASLTGQTAPLVVEGELRVATLLGPHVELLGTDENGVLSRIVAPAPDDGFEWDPSAPLLPGPPESELVVGRGHSSLEPVFPPPRRALVQLFGCGFGEGAVEGACLEDGDCDAGLTCDRSVCLPGPGCAETDTCDLCWGSCAPPIVDEDGGIVDGGPLADGGSLEDAGAGSDGGVNDGGEDAGDGG